MDKQNNLSRKPEVHGQDQYQLSIRKTDPVLPLRAVLYNAIVCNQAPEQVERKKFSWVESLRECILRMNLSLESRIALYNLCHQIAKKFLARLLEPTEFQCAFCRLAKNHKKWMRPVEKIRQRVLSDEDHFVEICKHLLAEHPVPEFLKTAFLSENEHIHDWYLYFARGTNLPVTEDLTPALSAKMVPFLSQVPKNTAIPEGLRWARARAMGASEQLAQFFAETLIIYEDRPMLTEAYRWKIARLCIRENDEDLLKIHQVCEWIVFKTRGYLQRDWKNFVRVRWDEKQVCLKRTSLEELYQRAKRFRELKNGLAACAWEGSGLPNRSWKNPIGGEWQMRECLSVTGLALEGVTIEEETSDLAIRCVTGSSYFFALRRKDGKKNWKLAATIEIDANTGETLQFLSPAHENPEFHARLAYEYWHTKWFERREE